MIAHLSAGLTCFAVLLIAFVPLSGVWGWWVAIVLCAFALITDGAWQAAYEFGMLNRPGFAVFGFLMAVVAIIGSRDLRFGRIWELIGQGIIAAALITAVGHGLALVAMSLLAAAIGSMRSGVWGAVQISGLTACLVPVAGAIFPGLDTLTNNMVHELVLVVAAVMLAAFWDLAFGKFVWTGRSLECPSSD
jgi:hypothetical protein